MQLTDQIYSMNPHWEDVRYDFKFSRAQLKGLISTLDKPFITTMTGPRRVGKTVLMKQMIQHLIGSEINRNRIFYFSFDEYRADIFNVIKEWTRALSLDLRNGNYWVFFDEIQYVDDWAKNVKILYDNYPNIKLVISGSASAYLKRGGESLAGRELQYKIYPLTFNEYAEFRGKRFISEEIKWNEYLNYMKRQLPALALYDIDPAQYVKEIVDKYVGYDIPQLFDVEDVDSLRTIFRIICKSPGEIIKAENLASELGINRLTVSKYLNALEDSFLIRKVYNYSKNPRKSEKRSKKIYPYFTTLHEYVRPYIPEFSFLAETEVAFQTNAEYFWNENWREIDFIVGEQLDVGIEVKMKKRITNKDIKWLLNPPFRLSKKIVVVPYNSETNIEGANAVSLHSLSEVL